MTETLKPAAHHVPPFPQLTEFSARPTLEAIQKHYRLHTGGFWFDPDTMRFWKTRLYDQVWTDYGLGAEDAVHYFVSSEAGGFGNFGRLYSVRSYRPRTGAINTVGEFQAYPTLARARTAAKRLAYSPKPTDVLA
jgi:hypothetical protein